MVMDTNFFQVESLFETENGEDLTVAIGVSTLVKVRSGKPFVYYAGAAWSGNPRFASFDRWNDMVKIESWKSLNDFYLSK